MYPDGMGDSNYVVMRSCAEMDANDPNISCTKISSNCAFAFQVCKCLKSQYTITEFLLGACCYGYIRAMLRCACDAFEEGTLDHLVCRQNYFAGCSRVGPL